MTDPSRVNRFTVAESPLARYREDGRNLRGDTEAKGRDVLHMSLNDHPRWPGLSYQECREVDGVVRIVRRTVVCSDGRLITTTTETARSTSVL